MNKTAKKNVSINDLYKELRALRREVAMFLPTESLEGYTHPKRILATYKEAIKEIPAHADRSNR